MKIALTKKQPWKKWTAIASFTLLMGYAGYSVSGKATKSIPLSQLSFQTVAKGDLDIYASAYGEFASAKERLLTAPALGKVSEILVRPGTKVNPDTIILHLTNPKLVQEVNAANGQLAQQLAQREAFKYEQQSERLNYQGRIADIEAEIEKAQLELSVNKNLMDLGVSSKIELQRAKLAVKQESRRLGFEKKKYKQFIEMQGHQLTQRDITITQQQAQVALLEQQLDDMKVKAGIKGSLQTLEIELGQSVQLGQSLAKVGSDEELIARLRLPQNQADQIDINALVLIDTQKGIIKGHITRIESVVSNGSVLAEVVIDEALTSNARPALSISAQVFVRNQQGANYIEQVPGFRPRSKQSVFVRDTNNNLNQRNVTFGELSGNKLVITAGLQSGEQLVSSDTQKYNQYQQLSITD
ncbi:MAG: HlyD family efflux transporter periplasmic adaptor subunit [Colwellia sp.]|uniref:efflux RND transporter periplasmic adaptor subunit n=1 Tax=Colwellia sp. TaxID=56799 RepID=UPI0025BB9EAB|nr:HlyD family efflux transporter periplasmic adaptor subunit [Colwellia sp.]NQZ25952.1 HlyD family efflux transporter periplasmic adaptor subunit [Colwellia sp.]